MPLRSELDGGQSHSLAWLGSACAAAGDSKAASRILAQLLDRATREYVAPLFLSYIQAPLGDREGALASLAEGLAHRNALIWWHLPYNPVFETLHSDPRHRALLEKIVPA